MADAYPNHLISIPRSIVSLKHYFEVHDQPFTRSALYVVVLAAAVTVLGVAIGLGSYFRDAPSQRARREKALTEKLAAVAFGNGKAQADGEQPRVLWEESAGTDRAAKRDAAQRGAAPRALVLVVDTTGETATIDDAAEAAGCALSRRVLVFGRSGVHSLVRAEKPGEKDKSERIPYAEEKRLAELRQLIEANGGAMPEPKVENEAATFDLEDGKVHVLLHTAELLVLVNTTAKDLGAQQARWVAQRENPRMTPPEFLVLVRDSGVLLKPIYEQEPKSLDFADQAGLSAAAVAQWIASTAHQTQVENLKRGLLPTVVQMMLFLCVELFFLALVSSVAGLIVNGVTGAGLAYGELLTIAIYAVTPARLVLPILIALLGLQASWLWAMPFAVGMVYAGFGTHHTARALATSGAPTL